MVVTVWHLTEPQWSPRVFAVWSVWTTGLIRGVRPADVQFSLWFLPRLPSTASKCKAQLMPAALPLSVLPHTPHVWILVHSFQMTAAGLIWTPLPHTHTHTHTHPRPVVTWSSLCIFTVRIVTKQTAVWAFKAGRVPVRHPLLRSPPSA